jgi:hypothetical protein
LVTCSSQLTSLNSKAAKTAARTGQMTQVLTILARVAVSVWVSLNRFQPTMPPTIAWVVDSAAEKAAMKEPPSALTAPSLPRVCAAPAPLRTAPRMTKTLQMMAAVVKRTICVPTAVPNTLAASLAPSDQPRNRPLERKKRTAGSIAAGWTQTVRLMV